MIFEALIASGLLTGVIYYRTTMDSRALKPYQQKWDVLMKELSIFNSESNMTFKVVAIEKINNGFIATIAIPPGLNCDMLEKHIKSIENYYEATVSIKNIPFKSICTVKIIEKKLENYPFEPVKLKEYELYIGKTFDGNDYILDMNKNSHIIFLGATGKGKTVELMMVLTNLIYNCSSKIEIHLSQIAKSETGMLRDCSCVKFYGNKLEDVTLDLERVAKLINYRSDVFDREGVSNIKEFNKYNPKNKMKRIYYVIEELSFFMPQSSDLDDIKYLKNKCWSAILEIVKAGRSCGIHFLCVSQRSTCTNLPSDVKSQLTRVTFTQISKVDSQNAIENDNACALEEMQCLVYGDFRAMEIIKVPFLKDGYISLHQFVKEIRIPKKLLEENKPSRETILETAVEKELENTLSLLKSDNNVEKTFYEDRRISDDELKDYLHRLNFAKKNNILIKDSNKKQNGIIRGGALKNDNKKR